MPTAVRTGIRLPGASATAVLGQPRTFFFSINDCIGLIQQKGSSLPRRSVCSRTNNAREARPGHGGTASNGARNEARLGQAQNAARHQVSRHPCCAALRKWSKRLSSVALVDKHRLSDFIGIKLRELSRLRNQPAPCTLPFLYTFHCCFTWSERCRHFTNILEAAYIQESCLGGMGLVAEDDLNRIEFLWNDGRRSPLDEVGYACIALV
jgi:hypothetical protein